jgi:TetR/AcrR family transcriptional regulator, cholesterol catabolism regulator
MDGATRAALDQLAQVPLRRAAMDRAEHTLFLAARDHGASFTDIAQALGLASRQAAEQRFHRLDRRVRSTTPPGASTAGAEHLGEGADPAPPAPRAVPATGHGTRSRETRRRLIDAAGQILAERGYASTRISDIAARADLRTSSVYHHFPSKDELIEEVLRFGIVAVHRRVHHDVTTLPPSADASARLTAAMNAHLQTMLGLDAVARAHAHAFAQLPDPIKERIRPYRRAYGALWSEIVGAAVEAGALRDDIHRYLLRLFVVNSVEAVSLWAWRSHRTADELSSTITKLIMEGAAAPAAPPRTATG